MKGKINLQKKLDAYQKAEKVIDSTKTREQHHSAWNYVMLFKSRFKDSNLSDKLYWQISRKMFTN